MMPLRGLALLAALILASAWFDLSGSAAEPKAGEKGGTVIGAVTAKDEKNTWIEVKADGEEKARRYVPNWVGGAPAKGGGPDKTTVQAIRDTPLNARVRLEWRFEERARVTKIEVLKKADDKK